MALPHHDPEDAIRRANAEREATALEFARLEAAAARRDEQRARVIRGALSETPALADALQRRGVVGDDRELGKLASKLMRAPLRDSKPGEANVHDIDGLLRDLHVARRGEFAGVVGELAARRQQLEARQRDLLRERDRLFEHERKHELMLEERRKAEAEGRAARVAAGEDVTDEDESDEDSETDSEEDDSDDSDDSEGSAEASKRRTGRPSSASRSRRPSVRAPSAAESLRPTQVILPRETYFGRAEAGAGGDPTGDVDEPRGRPSSPFLLDDRSPDALAHGDRDRLVRRLQRELGVKPDERVANFVPTRAKDRLLKMKLAHSSVSARLRYLESTASYDGKGTDVSQIRVRTPVDATERAVERMCRDIAEEICGAVADAVAARPTAERLERERVEWERRAAPRRLAMCRQALDDLVREVTAEEANAVVLEMEANHAAAAGFVSKAVATAALARLDGSATGALTFWEPLAAEKEARASRREVDAAKDAKKKQSTVFGGWFGSGAKKKKKGAGSKPDGERDAKPPARERRRRRGLGGASFWGGGGKKSAARPNEDEDGGDGGGGDFFAGGVGLGEDDSGSATDDYWSTSSSDEDDDYGYRTATDRRALQHVLTEMQRRRPPGLVFHHTQPLREASPPPGVGRGAPAAAAAGGGEGSSDSSDTDSSDTESDTDGSDDEAKEEKRRVTEELRRQEALARAEAKARAQPPPRSGVANLGMMDEPPAPSQAHRAASEAERRYWSSVRVAGAFDGKRTLEVKKGAVTSLAVASSGTSVNLAAGTSKGEVVVWRFPSLEEEPGEASDSEEEASAPPPPPKRTSWWGGGGKKAAPASTPKRERRTPKPPAEPFVLARAKCSAHPDQEKEPKSKTAELAPSSLFSAVTSVAWSADASQLCSAERGGTSRMWSLVGDAAEPSAKKTSSKIRMGETLVLSSSHHASSSPLPDEKPPPPPESMPHDRGGAGARASDTPPKKTKKELEKELEERERAAEEARAARVAAREQWPRDAQTLSTFFPAYTLAGRQPFAMFTRPNGDVVRASPTTRPAAICNATRAPASGKVQRELAMFRGAKTWARRSTFAAVERERRLADADEAGAPNDESDVDVDDDVVAGASTLVPTRRLDNAAHRGGGDSSGARRDAPDGDGKDWEHVRGSTFVAGTDDLLSVAENYGSGAGGYMARSERRALVSPETHPLHPGKTPKDGEAPRDAYVQDLYRGHSSPVVFLDVLPDSGSLLSVDAEGMMCLWPAFQGGRARSGFGWYSPLGSWKLPGEVTAQTPAGMPVPVTGGGDSSRSHWPWLVSRQKGRRVVVEVPKDRAWMERDARAALAVEGLTRPRSYAEQLELEPVKRRLKIPGVDPDVESAEEKWRRAGPRLGELDTPDLDPDEEKTTIVIPEGETRDYYVSQYDARGKLVGRHRQRHVTARAAAPVVGACIASDGGVPDLIVIRRVSGLCAAAVKAGGVDAGLAAVPYFTAHCYSLDDMRPTVPRVDMPNPFAPPKGRGADAKPSRAKPGKDLEDAAAAAAKGWRDPSPYPFALAKATPSLGSENLVCATGSASVGVFSLATGVMVYDCELPGIPGSEHVAVMRTMENPNPAIGGERSVVRTLLAVATAGSSAGAGGKIRIYALDEGAAQIVRVDVTRQDVAKTLPAPGDDEDHDPRDVEDDESATSASSEEP